MPQLKLEYTDNIIQDTDFDSLFLKIHQILFNTGGINIENCKSRAVKIQNYFIGQGDANNAFIHLQIQFLEGRSDSLKQAIGHQILNLLKEYYKASLENLNLQITVEITDIQKKTYFKIPEGSLFSDK